MRADQRRGLLLASASIVATVLAGTAHGQARPAAIAVDSAATGNGANAADGAQDAGGSVSRDDADSPAQDNIIVTGSAGRNQRTIAAKRSALGVVDSVSQDDTGDLADETVADALIRLPGINTMETLYGEQSAKYVSVRGISPDLNFVSFDGMAMYSAANNGDGTRRVDLALIPTQVAQMTQVAKSFTPDIDAGAIGGVTNIVPYSALDGRNHWLIDVSGEYQPNTSSFPGFNAMGGNLDTRFGGGIKGLYVHKFGAQDQFGLVVSGVYNQESWQASKPNANGRTYYTAAGTTAKADLSDWNGYDPMPTLMRPMDYAKTRRLFGGYVGLEYRASDTVKLSLSAYDYKQVEYQTLSDFYAETFSGVSYASPHVATFKIGRIRPAYDYDKFTTESRGAIFKAAKEWGSDTSLELRGGYGLSHFHDVDLGMAYSYAPTNDFVTWDMTEQTPAYTFSNPADMVDTSKFKLFSASDMFSDSVFENYEGRIDLKHNYSGDSQGFGFAAGFDGRNVNAVRDLQQTTYTTTNGGALGDIGTVVNQGTLGWNYPTIFLNYERFADTAKKNLTVNTASSANSSNASDYTYDETVLAGYAAGMFARGGFRGIAGLRYDDVRFHADVPRQVNGTYAGAFTRYNGGYSHLLPYVTLTQSLGDDAWRLRAAFSQTLGRPAFSDIATAEIRDNQNLTITRGNPNLKPRESTNGDIAIDRYFNGNDGLISLAGFYKHIKNDIFSLATREDIDGVAYTVTQPLNASHSELKGIEATFVDNHLFAGGIGRNLGISLNASRIWAKMDFIVGGKVTSRDNVLYQPNWLANASLFYALPQGGEFRVAYQWADRNLNTVNAQPYQDYVLEARGQMNAALRWALKRNLTVKLEADNILGNNKSMMHGYYSERYTLSVNRKFFLDIVLTN
jgi:iron complex outermembrane receptor protein